METNIISLSYIFTTNLWISDFQTGFKDEDVEAWQPSDIIKAQQLTRQSRNKLWVTLTPGLHSQHSSPLCLLNGFLGIFTHCKFSPDSFSLTNQHCILETKAYKVESSWIQSQHYFVNMLSGESTQNMLIGRMETNRTGLKHADVKVCLVFAQMCFQILLAEPRIIQCYLFTELFYVYKHATFSF